MERNVNNSASSTRSLRNLLVNFKMPNTYVIIFCMVIVASLMTWLIPAGEFARATDEVTKQTIVLEDSYHNVPQNPVGLIGIFTAIVTGFSESADIIFFIIFAYGFVHILIKNGTFNAMIGSIIKRFGSKTHLMLPVIMFFFSLLGSTMGLYEETYGMFPIFISLSLALGYDAIVGGAIVSLSVATGFAAATLNPFTIGVAQGLAGVEIMSGIGFRILCFVIFTSITIIYVYRYAVKIKKDPTKSLLYGTTDYKISNEENAVPTSDVTIRQKICMSIFLVTIITLIFGTLYYKWYIKEISVLFFIAMTVAGFAGGFTANEIAENFVEAAKSMMFGALMVGLSRGILVVLQQGRIIDTVVYGLSQIAAETSGTLSGIIMVFVQNILNFFIPSGSGQAAVSIPILAPLGDMVGISRQSVVLAFQFGDGFSNMFWPTSVCMICGLMKIPVGKWYKFITPLFGIFFVAQIVLMSVAILIGY